MQRLRGVATTGTDATQPLALDQHKSLQPRTHFVAKKKRSGIVFFFHEIPLDPHVTSGRSIDIDSEGGQAMRSPPWKVGELARRTGLSVRTLHWYDEIGLLKPSWHTQAGHRLYTAADVVRLQQILSLRQLGFALNEVRACLEDADFSPVSLIEAHLTRLREQIDVQRRLCERLESVAACLRAAETISVEDLLQTIEEMNMFEKYYTPEQQEWLKQRGSQVGEERIRQVETQEWPNLIAAVRAEMDQGSDPASGPVQAFAQRWLALVQEFTGGDSGIEKSLKTMYQQEQTIHGMDVTAMRPMMEYIDKAIASLKKGQ
jgi:DNA-binding transcriptional MerR regulator